MVCHVPQIHIHDQATLVARLVGFDWIVITTDQVDIITEVNYSQIN